MINISNFKRFNDLTEDISNSIKKCDSIEDANYIIEFLKNKKENYTYSKDTNKYYINSFFPSIPSISWNRMVNGISGIMKYNKRIPLQADIVVTGKCHCNCWHCFRSKDKSFDMELSKIKECIDSLYKLGTATIGITGGEPMQREDILDIINLIPDGIEGQLYTTGHGIDDTFATNLKETNLTRCIISLDHFDEKMANKLRQYPEAFNDVLQAIKALTNKNIYTAVTVCITNELINSDSLQKYFDFIKDLGVQEIRVVLPIPQGNLEGTAVGRFYGKAMGIVKQIKREYSKHTTYPVIVNFCEFESADYIGCGAGSNYISINNDGLVTPCVAVPLSFGNVHNNTLEEIYHKMGECFPESDCVCFGIASGSIISKEKINTNSTILSTDISFEIAKKCKHSSEKAAFFRCNKSK